jgi:hypothetical protein
VIDAPGESRRFSVEVALESFRATPLKFQDGPLLARERVEQELQREALESRAEAHMKIGDPDIVRYIERHYPPKARKWSAPKQTVSTDRG